MNTGDFLSIGRAICADRKLLVFEGNAWSYEQTYNRVNKLANALRNLGIQKNDRVGMLQVNCNQYLECYFASVKTGAIFVPLNFRAKAEELRFMLENAAVKILFTGKRYLEMVNELLPRLTTLQEVVCLDEIQTGGIDFESLLEKSSAEDITEHIDDEDVTILMYTSGTTGRPKGVPLRHSGFVSYILGNVEPANPDIAETNLLTVPLYHVAGVQAMLAAVYGGRTLVLMRQFETEGWMQTVQEQKVTRAMLVPTMLKWVIDHPDFEDYDLSSLNVITYGAAPMPLEVIKTAIMKLPWVRFINAFGQTETASTITVLGPEDHVLDGSPDEIERKLQRLTCSIGKPLPDIEIKIVDPDGNSLPHHQVGEIMARGSRIMSGYWDDAVKTKSVLTNDGWLHTGDKGWSDENGYIYLSGRGDDLIIRGGENISPGEIENVLFSFPKIEDAACIGVPNPEWGQEPIAIVVLKKGMTASTEEIMDFCKDKLAGFKRPKSIVFVDRLPRSHLGKLSKKELHEKYDRAPSETE